MVNTQQVRWRHREMGLGRARRLVTPIHRRRSSEQKEAFRRNGSVASDGSIPEPDKHETAQERRARKEVKAAHKDRMAASRGARELVKRGIADKDNSRDIIRRLDAIIRMRFNGTQTTHIAISK